MKSVLFALDGVLRDAQGEPIKDNIALARALYCAGHDEIMAHALKCAGVHTWRYENA
mgnify:CR=1 FL=1